MVFFRQNVSAEIPVPITVWPCLTRRCECQNADESRKKVESAYYLCRCSSQPFDQTCQRNISSCSPSTCYIACFLVPPKPHSGIASVTKAVRKNAHKDCTVPSGRSCQMVRHTTRCHQRRSSQLCRSMKHLYQSLPDRGLKLRSIPRDLDLPVGVPWVPQTSCPIEGQPCGRYPSDLERSAEILASTIC